MLDLIQNRIDYSAEEYESDSVQVSLYDLLMMRTMNYNYIYNIDIILYIYIVMYVWLINFMTNLYFISNNKHVYTNSIVRSMQGTFLIKW